jgi:polysaccharide biosynthesis transport protein
MNSLEPYNGGRTDAHPEQSVVPYRRASSALLQVFEGPEAAPPPQEERSFQLSDILQVLLRRRWLILGVVVLGVAASAAMTLRKTAMYAASATIEVQKQTTEIIEGGSVNPAEVADGDFMATQFALLKSRALAERVAEALALPLDARFASQDASRPDRLAQAAATIMNGLDVGPVARSRLIQVTYRSPHSEETARIANAVAESFIQMNLERRYNDTAYARAFLEERLNTTKAALEDAERKLVSYSRENEILDLSSVGGSEIGSSLDASSLVALNASLTAAQDARISAEEKFREVQLNPNLSAIVGNATVERLQAARVELNGEYQQKLSTFKPDYPEMKEIVARIEDLDREIVQERAAIVGALEAEYRSALAREFALRGRVNELKGQVQDLRGRSIDYNILGREADTLRSQYDGLLQRFKEVSIASGVGSSQLSIVDPALVPGFPYEPSLSAAIISGLGLSLAFALALAFLVDYVDDTIKTPEDLKSKLGLAVIGVVPRASGEKSIVELLSNPKSEVSEAISSARTALQFATPTGTPRTVLVTGVRPSEGKTSVALALAFSFAGVGKRVLIIDADMRRPSFAADRAASAGLSGVLTGSATLIEQVVRGAAKDMYLLPAGVLPPNPAELLSSPRMAQLLHEAKANFDVVIVDSPPVLAFADAPALSAVCEATLLVMQAGGVRRPMARRAIDRLAEGRGHIVGAVLTKFDSKRAGYSSAYSYAYKYNEGEGSRGSVQAEVMARRRISIFATKDDPQDQQQPL